MKRRDRDPIDDFWLGQIMASRLNAREKRQAVEQYWHERGANDGGQAAHIFAENLPYPDSPEPAPARAPAPAPAPRQPGNPRRVRAPKKTAAAPRKAAPKLVAAPVKAAPVKATPAAKGRGRLGPSKRVQQP